MRSALLLVVLFVLCNVSNSALAPESRGTDFWVAFGMNGGASASMRLYVSADFANTVIIRTKTAVVSTVNVPAHSTVTVDVSSYYITLQNTIQTMGLRVYSPSNSSFTLAGINTVSASTDAFLAFPLQILGKDHVAAGYTGLSGYPGYMYVVAPFDGTSVTFSGSRSLDNLGNTATYNLNQYETVLVGINGGDITGFRVTSTKPISFFGGSKCSNVPVGTVYCNTLVDQIPPVNTWDKAYITVPFATRLAGDIIRVIAGTDGTQVKVNGVVKTTINNGAWYEFSSTIACLIETSVPSMVMQYDKGTAADGVSSDPFQVWVPPVSQYASNYYITSATESRWINYVSIVIESGKQSGLTNDGAAISGTWTAIPGTAYVYINLPIAAGSHWISHSSPIETFSVVVYGFGPADGYGYVGGSRLSPLNSPCVATTTVPGDGIDNDCDGRVDEEIRNGVDDDLDGAIDEDLAVDTCCYSNNVQPSLSVSGSAADVGIPCGGSIPAMPTVTATLACTTPSTQTVTPVVTVTPGACPDGSSIKRVWTAYDECGRSATITQTITITSVCGNGIVEPSEQCDGGDCCTTSCTFRASSTVCRASNGACDVAESCTGSSSTCPADTFLSSATVCRASNGVCDVAETCTGTGASCPADSFQSSSVTCRASSGFCDVAETCTGTGASCPADSFKSSSTVCRASAGVCDAQETCDGSTASCPADSFQSSSVTCRPSAGICDIAEQCTGSSASCPADSVQSSSTTCRASNGPCDVAEQCTGSSTSCPADSFQSSSTTCRASNGPCDVAEQCTGSSASCPADSFQSSSVTCRASNGVCDVAEQCTGSSASCPADSFQSSTTTCRASNGICDVAEQCTGSSASCPSDSFLPSTTTCRASNGDCDVVEQCTGSSASCPSDSFKPSTFTCRASNGICDVAEQCTGTGANCPSDSFQSSSTVCRASAGICDVVEQCTGTGASCPADSFESSTVTCRASAGICDVAEQCTGSAAACPTDSFQSSATTCRASNGICDVAEQCTGSTASCPSDSFQSSTTTCRAAAGDCDVAEQCTGTGASCPSDSFVPSTTTCRASAGICDVAEQCTGSTASCPSDSFQSSTTTCRASAGICDVAEQCTGTDASCPSDSFQSSSVTCRASAGICDVVEKCTGTGVACPSDAFAPSSTTCRASIGQCDAPEYCPGTGATCPVDLNGAWETDCIGLDFVAPGQVTSFLSYDVISFNNFVGSTGNVEGRVAVKNNLSVGYGWSVGSSTGNSPSDSYINYGVIAGGNVVWSSGEIYPHNKQTPAGLVTENMFAGGSFSGADYLRDRITGNCSTAGCLAQEFEDARSCYVAYQNSFASRTDNVQKLIQWSALILTCNSATASEYVVTIHPSEMSQYTYVTQENCAPNARWIVNIDTTSNVVMNGVTISSGGSVIYNVIGSGRTISVGWIQVIGSILAPNNILDQPGGSVTGKVVVGDVTKSLNLLRYSCFVPN